MPPLELVLASTLDFQAPLLPTALLELAAQVLHWTRDWGRAQELAWRVAVLYAEQFEQLRDATLGVAQWLAALRKANTPCALVSHMPAAHVKVTRPSGCLPSHGRTQHR